MAIVALVISAGRGNPDLYRLSGSATGCQLAIGPILGAALGLCVVGFTRLATRRWQWARDLHMSFRNVLGPLSKREIVVLAVASSIGEELLFRGALLPWFGVWIQAIGFAALHIGPSRRFAAWTLSAFVLGAVFGELARHTGNLGGPIAAHFTINYLNLRYIVSTPLPHTAPPRTTAP